jgi:hypothetical protein
MGRSQDEKGADKANAVRKSQQRDRSSLAKDIEANQKQIASLNDEAAPIRAEVRKVEAEVGPIKYIAKFIYGEHGADENMLEKAVTWIIVLIVVVFDPLAVIMLLAAQMTFGWTRERKEQEAEGNSLTTESEDNIIIGPTVTELDNAIVEPPEEKVKETTIDFEGVREPGGEWIQTGPEFKVPAKTSETPTTALGGDITASEELTADSTNKVSELEQWNAMIKQAEKEAIAQQDSTVEERVAKGETYIDNDGKEIALEESLPEPDFPATDESKKKTYMIKDQTGKMQVKNKEQ